MSTLELKNKINKSLAKMDEARLQFAYLVLKEISNQQKYSNLKIEKNAVDKKIAKGIRELGNGEGTDFRLFLNEMHASYGKKK